MKTIRRRYRPDTLILETEIETSSGVIRLIDFMPPRGTNPDIVRIVEGVRGRVRMQMDLTIRFDYGKVVPWVRKRHGALEAVAGPDALILHTPIETRGKNLSTVAEWTVTKGDRIPCVLTWYASHEPPPREVDAEQALRDTERYWTDWSNRCCDKGEWREAVTRSLITLKSLTYAPTGGIVAALTTSCPKKSAACATGTTASAGCATRHRVQHFAINVELTLSDRRQPRANADHVWRAR